ncbi:MAG: hypothetical protein WDZ30_07855 [Cellvibrionaceae bacterium]
MNALESQRYQVRARESFRVVFWGETARGFSRTEVAHAFARRFNIRSRRQLAHIFSGRVITLKRNLTTAEAHRYITAIQELGGICRMESEYKDYFSQTEFMERKTVSFLQEDFSSESLSLQPKG